MSLVRQLFHLKVIEAYTGLKKKNQNEVCIHNLTDFRHIQRIYAAVLLGVFCVIALSSFPSA